MAKTNSYNSGMRILKTLEYLHNLKEPEQGAPGVQVKPTDLARFLSEECGETTRETAKDILNAIIDSDTGYLLQETKSSGGRAQYWYRRPFTLEQISLLSTIISSSIFLNEEEIKTLLTQLKSLTSKLDADELSEAAHFLRPRMMNNNALANLRIIHDAINNKEALRFYVGRFDADMNIYYEKKVRGDTSKLKRITLVRNSDESKYRFTHKNAGFNADKQNKQSVLETIVDKPKNAPMTCGEPVICFPYTLVWDNSRCYLICGKEQGDKVIYWNYRVDRMFELKKWTKITYREPVSSPYYDFESKSLNAEKYIHSIFKMFPSTQPPVPVKLRFKQNLTRVIVEKFGYDVDLVQEENGYVHTEVRVQISRQFYGWLAGFYADDLCLAAPQEEVDLYVEYLRKSIDFLSP